MNTATRTLKLPLGQIAISAVGLAVVMLLVLTKYFPDFYSDNMQAYPGLSLLVLLVVSALIQVGIWRLWRIIKS